MIVEVSKTQDAEVGDGTTTAAVLSGELLSKAEELIMKGVHSTIISEGYRHAAEKCREILETITIAISPDDEAALIKIAGTAITGKGAESYKETLSALTVKAVRSIVEEEEDGFKVNVILTTSYISYNRIRCIPEFQS